LILLCISTIFANFANKAASHEWLEDEAEKVFGEIKGQWFYFDGG